MPSNRAAYLTTYKSPLEVKDAPYSSALDGQIVVRNHAMAINPVDWASQLLGAQIFPWLNLPFVLGSDVAGEVVELGSDVTRFRVGDRVVGQALGFQHNDPTQGAFQEYTVLLQGMCCKIPDDLDYEKAAVLPLGLGTAASGLFQKDFLALDHPSFPSLPKGKSLLVWGGSTSVGCNAVQLATAAGYEVISTSSPKNFELVEKLGAKKMFDYSSASVVEDIIKYLEGKTIAGSFAIGATTAPNNGSSAGEACLEIVKRCKGTKFVAMAMVGPAELAPAGVKAKFVQGDQMKSNEVGEMIYGRFLPKSLAEGTFVCAPDAIVAGKGLDKIQEAFDLQQKGVSAKKIVVTL